MQRLIHRLAGMSLARRLSCVVAGSITLLFYLKATHPAAPIPRQNLWQYGDSPKGIEFAMGGKSSALLDPVRPRDVHAPQALGTDRANKGEFSMAVPLSRADHFFGPSLRYLFAGSLAAVIYFKATDLANTTPGQDLWQYSYTVSGLALAAGQGFSIQFIPALYKTLQSPPPTVNGDWDVLALQPDVALHSSVIYDALALRSNPSLGDFFTVTFIWLGTGTPDAQAYTVYDTNFSTVSQGQTTSVPEPATALLILSGFALAVLHPRHRRTR